MYDYLVVGAGLFGATFAQKAIESRKKVLIIEKRAHIGGNVYTENDRDIVVHKYGPHIFHTNDDEIVDYISRFCKLKKFVNSPLAFFKGEFYNLPFNMNTFKKIWGDISEGEAKKIIEEERNKIENTPSNLEEQAVSLVGKELYEKLVKGYSEKQWGHKCTDLPADIIKRIPIRFNYDNNYYNDRYQGIPENGYTDMISKMISGADIMLNTDYLDNKGYYNSLANHVIYTGTIDSYFNYTLGILEYRSLRFESETLNIKSFQGNAVVNYTDVDVPWTRIVEHKFFNCKKKILQKPYTIITKEYSQNCGIDDDPYYPVNNERNNRLYMQYATLAGKEKNVSFGGRLGAYRYIDMDVTIRNAIDLAKRLLY